MRRELFRVCKHKSKNGSCEREVEEGEETLLSGKVLIPCGLVRRKTYILSLAYGRGGS